MLLTKENLENFTGTEFLLYTQKDKFVACYGISEKEKESWGERHIYFVGNDGIESISDFLKDCNEDDEFFSLDEIVKPTITNESKILKFNKFVK